jgi:hypothetical protein
MVANSAQQRDDKPAHPDTPDTTEPAKDKLPKDFMMTSLESLLRDDGWSSLSQFGSYLNQVMPDFDPRSFGYKKLSDLVRLNSKLFEIEERPTNGSDNKNIYLRPRKP